MVYKSPPLYFAPHIHNIQKGGENHINKEGLFLYCRTPADPGPGAAGRGPGAGLYLLPLRRGRAPRPPSQL